ncbi:hypothetical protein ABH922_005165 [Rhodococcus sp. 27YEA15]|uniref:hypothetical protein n=1 Tax=Rhodococcus sp. 27YEA15 TaxID=3156259 RepID=UPI003C798045
MSRVPWSRYEGDDIEAFAAMCICRERPSARRIRPSRGDGGIDVYVPLGDNHVEVYQVKKFAANLTPNQLVQILKSYNRIKAYAAKRGWTIDTWHLTLPLNPTPENDTWFDEMTESDPFEATWKGFEVFDNWAADFPQVIDYYLEGGRDQLAQELSRFHATTKIMLPEVDPETALKAYRGLEPAAVVDRIALLNVTLNDADPHYIYDFAVGTAQSAPPNLPDGYPALVTSVSNQVEGRVVTVHILARCAESLYERPITHKGTIVVDKDSDEEREWRKFLDYGLAPSRPLRIRELVADLPGGLGGTTDEGLLFIYELENPEAEYDRVMSVFSPDEVKLGEVPIHFSAPSSNHDGTGLSTRGTDPSGILTVEILSKKRERDWDITYNFTIGDVTGHFAADIAPALALVHHAVAPNTFRISNPRALRRKHNQRLTHSKPRNRETRAAGIRHDYIQALATIQQYADNEIKIPDLDSITADEASETIRIGRLLRDTDITIGWDKLSVDIHKGIEAPEPEVPHAWVADVPLQISIAGTTIPLGWMRAVFEAGHVAERKIGNDGRITAVIRPALGKNTARLMWAGPDSIND